MNNIFIALSFTIVFTINLNAQESSNVTDAIKTKKEIVENAAAQVVNMTVDTLKSMIDHGGIFTLIDVRTEGEYLAGHIKGAVWIPRGKLEFVIQNVTLDPNANLVLYCRSGSRSALATLSVMDMGYNNVYNVTGGFREWTASGNHIFNRHGEIAVIAFEKNEVEGGN